MVFGIKDKKTRFARTLRREDEDFDDEDELEEEDLEEDKKPRKKTFKNKDFKDLNPTDRKARKEPVKPWGAKERILVLIIILATAGISGFLALSARGWKLPQLKVPAFSIDNLFKEETIVIEGD